MDQPAHPEKQRLKMAHGSFEVLEPSLAFLRLGIATGIDSLRRPLLSVSWAASTVFRYVTLRGPTHDDGSIPKRPGPRPTVLPRQKPLNRRRATKLKFRTRVYQSR